MSQKSRDSISVVLSKHYARVGTTIVDDLSDLKALVALQPDLVFLGMKFIPSDVPSASSRTSKIWITDYLDEHGIVYTGSRQPAHELELNKSLAKQRVLEAGLDTSPFWVIKQNQLPISSHMGLTFPLFVKPADRGAGMGIDSDSVVHNYPQLRSKARSIADELQSDSLLEEYLPGREFSVAILKNEQSSEFSVMPIELIAPPNKHGDRILGKHVKSADTERFCAVTDQIIKTKVSDLALSVFQALGARDYGRIDIRLNRNGTPQFLEANLIPSLLRRFGNFPKACLLNLGLDYESMILHIVRLGLSRQLLLNETMPEPNIIGNLLLPELIPVSVA